jgi:hypothetical protein
MVVLLAACHASRPAGVPADAVHVTHDRTVLKVEGPAGASAEAEWTQFAADPTDPVDPGLAGAFGRVRGTAGVWLDVPADTEFWAVRRMLGSASEVDAGPVWLGVGPDAVRLADTAKFTLASCPADGSTVVPIGAEPLVTLSLQAGREGAWVVASARFVPVTDRGPTDGLSPACLSGPACDAIYPEGPLRAACTEGGGTDRVALGGATGCFLPIARSPEEVAQWRTQLPAAINALGLADHRLQVVMPEARTRSDAILAVLGGFVDAGAPVPALGTTALVEGNDGPPVCNAPVGDAAALAIAGARWLGSLRPPEAPAAQTESLTDGQ